MKSSLNILFIVAFLAISCSQTQNQSFEQVLGEWNSVKLAGSDIGDFIEQISFTFSADSTFVGTAVMTDSTADEKKGGFNITSDSLMIMVNDRLSAMKYSFSKDTLIIYDPSIDSRVYLLKNEN
tara:strand:- start:2574 stop:2945 length:372 start_codon:yes stop_codon:yes gene_type:complete